MLYQLNISLILSSSLCLSCNLSQVSGHNTPPEVSLFYYIQLLLSSYFYIYFSFEFLYNLPCIFSVLLLFPYVMFCYKSLPSHQILHYSPYFSFIQYFFHFLFLYSFYFHWFYFFYFLSLHLFSILYYSTNVYYQANSH